MKGDPIGKCTVEANRGDWNVFYFVLCTICMPIALPMVILNLWKRLRIKANRETLPGKVVLITGASSGLGEALAHVFYNAGCKVILAARRIEELERVKKDLLALSASNVTYPPTVLALDLTQLNDIPVFASKAVNVHNQIDILINNGGISVRADIISTAVDIDLKVMLVNYFGAVALTKALMPSMIKRGTGHLCFISSVQGKFAIPYRSAYSASKHALQAFADSLRAEVTSKNVHVTVVSPGYIRTQLSINALTSTGDCYGKTDPTTATGTAPDKMAKYIFQAILEKESDVMICNAQAKIAYYLRILCPSLYFWIMRKRAHKLLKEKKKEA